MATYYDPRKDRLSSLERIEAINAQKNVGALGASNQTNPEVKAARVRNLRAENAALQKKNRDALKIKKENEGKGNEGADKNKPKESKWSQMTKGEKAVAGLNIAKSALNTIGMLSGDDDEILSMGSGHTYSSGYNPEMHIGRLA